MKNRVQEQRLKRFKSAAARWQALVERRPEADGAFVYGVTTTGIYCRPNCRSRLPRKRHVKFFETASEAMTAGFRPCKRCQPDGLRPEADIDARLSRVCRQLDAAEGKLSLETLAKSAGFSASHFHRLFKAQIGLTPGQYQANRRLVRLKQTLRRSPNVTAAVYEAGYGSLSRAYEHSALGMTPRQYRNGGTGMEIRFGVGPTPLGLALIASTGRGICSIAFGSSPRELREGLKQEFPRAVIREDDKVLSGPFAQLKQFLADPPRGLPLALDLHGTTLQRRVWHALQQVPPGKTVSYSQLARRAGKPRAIRAVASACAANRIAIAVPCHRALRSDGSMGGYRWGLERKTRLLEIEKNTA